MREQRVSVWHYAVWTVPVILGLGMLSGWVSNSGYGNDWFDALRKPATMPPGWTFGAAWTLLYILLGLAFALLLAAAPKRGRGIAVGLFSIQMLLNFSWSPIFFGMGQAKAGLVVIVLMLAMSVAAAVMLYRIDRRAGLLMVPYLAWLTFAAHLNYEIIRLNPGV